MGSNIELQNEPEGGKLDIENMDSETEKKLKDLSLEKTTEELATNENQESNETQGDVNNINTKDQSTFIKGKNLNDFDEKQQKILKEAGIINEEGEMDSDKFQNFQKDILRKKGLLGENGEIDQEKMKNREKGQEFLKVLYENPIQVNYILSKDPKKDKIELVNGYGDILTKLGCFNSTTKFFNITTFNVIKKDLEERKKSDQEFEENLKTPEESEIINIKRELVINKLKEINQKPGNKNQDFGEKIVNLIGEDFFKEDPDKQELIKEMFSNSFFINNSFPTFFQCLLFQDKKQKNEIVNFEDIVLPEGTASGALEFIKGLEGEEKQAFLDFFNNKANPKDLANLDGIHQQVLGKYLTRYLTPELLNGYVEDVYKQQFCREKIDTSQRFKQEVKKHTVTVERTTTNSQKKANESYKASINFPKKKNPDQGIASTKNSYEKGALADNKISSKEILENAMEEDEELQEGIDNLSNTEYQNQIKEIIIVNSKKPKHLFKQANKIFNGGSWDISDIEEQNGEKKQVGKKQKITFEFKDFYEENQISNLFSETGINNKVIENGIQEKAKAFNLSQDQIVALQEQVLPHITKQLEQVKENIRNKIKRNTERIPIVESKINQQILTDYLDRIRSTFASNKITEKFSFEGGNENKFGEKEGLKIENGKMYIKGSCENSPCNFCVDLETGEVKINTSCSFEKGSFYFNQNEPNYPLFNVPPFKECQQQALKHIPDFLGKGKQFQGNSNVERGSQKMEGSVVGKLESRVSENEFYNVLLKGLEGQGPKIENINKDGHSGLFPFFEDTISKINNKDDYQEMTSFLQRVYALGGMNNTPQGLQKNETGSPILQNLFSPEKLKNDYKNLKTNKENSILMLLTHFIHQNTDGTVTFKNGEATKWLDAIGENKGKGVAEDQEAKLKKIESEIFFGKGDETYKDYTNTKLAQCLKEGQKSEPPNGPDINRESAFQRKQFTPYV